MISGLTNQGNTCYLNSALQLLISSDIFIEFILHTDLDDPIMKQFRSLLQQYHVNTQNTNTNGSNVTNTSKFVLAVHKNKRLRYFSNFKQHDAYEFIVSFIELFETIVSNTMTIPPAMLARNIRTVKVGETMSILFDNVVTTKVRCLACGYQSIKSEHEKTISLPVMDVLSHKSSEPLLDWTCDKCHQCGKACIDTTFSPKSKYLIINLNRYRTLPKGKTEKIHTPMNMPECWLGKYYLRAFIHHDGTINGGHYCCYRKINQQWYLCNDSSIRKVHGDNMRLNQGLVYLYVRQSRSCRQ